MPNQFNPDWLVHPRELIFEYIECSDMHHATKELIIGVISQPDFYIDDECAELLSKTFDNRSADFWRRLQTHYDSEKIRLNL